DADRDAGFVFNFFTTGTDFVPGIRLDAGIAPKVGEIVDRIGDEAVREGEVPLGLGVVGALDREIDRLAVFLLAFGIDVLHVDDLSLKYRRWRQEQHEVVTPLRRNFRRSAGFDQREVDVVDNHLSVVLLAPVLGVFVVEPLVVGRNEVAPLQDLQGLCGAGGRRMKERTDARRRACGSSRLDDVAARWAATGLSGLHDFLPSPFRRPSRNTRY